MLILAAACAEAAKERETGVSSEEASGRGAGGAAAEGTDIYTQWDDSWERSDSILAALWEYGRHFGDSRMEVRESLGEPQKTSARAVENPDQLGTDSIITWTYDGLRFDFYWIEHKGHEVALEVEQISLARTLPYGIAVGRTSGSSLLAVLGKPEYRQERNDTLMLRYPKPFFGADEYMQFEVLADTVRAIKWLFYFD